MKFIPPIIEDSKNTQVLWDWFSFKTTDLAALANSVSGTGLNWSIVRFGFNNRKITTSVALSLVALDLSTVGNAILSQLLPFGISPLDFNVWVDQTDASIMWVSTKQTANTGVLTHIAVLDASVTSSPLIWPTSESLLDQPTPCPDELRPWAIYFVPASTLVVANINIAGIAASPPFRLISAVFENATYELVAGSYIPINSPVNMGHLSEVDNEILLANGWQSVDGDYTFTGYSRGVYYDNEVLTGCYVSIQTPMPGGALKALNVLLPDGSGNYTIQSIIETYLIAAAAASPY